VFGVVSVIIGCAARVFKLSRSKFRMPDRAHVRVARAR
jgi:hypothetical protein